MPLRTNIVRDTTNSHSVRSISAPARSRTERKEIGLRKVLAGVLLVFLGGVYAAPLFQSASTSPEARLPACCRRNGTHHCAMMGQTSRTIEAGGPRIGSVPPRCPVFPHSAALSVESPQVGPAPSSAFFANVPGRPAVQSQFRATYRLSLDRSRQKRGPPALRIS